jgi:hypothetical protein
MVIEMKSFKSQQPISRQGFTSAEQIGILARQDTALVRAFNQSETIPGRCIPTADPAHVPQPL